MFDLLMIKFAELNTKSGNKKHFIKILERNVRKQLSKWVNLSISANRDRILVYLHGEDSGPIIKRLQLTPGIENISIAVKTEKSYEAVEKKMKVLLPMLKKETFAVDVKRADKRFEMSSIEMQRKLGTFITANSNLKVNLKNYDHKVKVEVRETACYIYFDTFKAVGGLPWGTSAKTISLLSGGIDSPVASYEIMKRGCTVEFLHFASPPATGEKSLNKVKAIAKIVASYGGNTKLHIVDFMELQTEIFCGAEAKYRITLMRRLFYKIANLIAIEEKALAIVTGESIGQVASQTLESIYSTSSDLPITIFRPLSAHNKSDIIKMAEKIGTFELSISEGEDCCSLFVPKNPITKPILIDTKIEEEKLIIDNMIEKAVANREIIEIKVGEENE